MSETLDKLNKEFKKMNAQFRKMKYNALEELVSQLTPEQQVKLFRICSNDGKIHEPNNIPESKLDQAIELCERTIKINKETVTIRGCEHKEVVGHKFCTECGKPMWATTRIKT